MTEKTHENDNLSPIGSAAEPDKTRRQLLKAGTLAGGALLLSAPHIRNAEAAQGQVWKIQSTWDSGTTGYKLFEEWANSFKEKSNGELRSRSGTTGRRKTPMRREVSKSTSTQ